MRRRLLMCLGALLALTSSGCTGRADGTAEIDSRIAVDPPKVRECRVLAPEDIAEPSNDSPVVRCERPHSAETYLVGELRGRAADADWDDPALGAAVYDRCQSRWIRFVGADESLALRTMLGWAWFRPTEEQWRAGARWFRCDVVAGTDASARLLPLPATARGVLLGRPDDRWMACIAGESVSDAPWVPCAAPHTWRAVTTIVVGEEKEPYPGDRLVEVITRDFCRTSVVAWLGYPLDYAFGYTSFHRPEWERGNRRSVCWARTDR